MDILHKDVRSVIIRYLTLLDLVNWSRVDKFSYNIVYSSFDNHVYNIALNSKINIKGVNMINTNQYYKLYHRVKYNKKNIKFELNLNEVFIYIKKINKCIVMGTFLKNVGYIIYYFHNEVNKIEKLNPIYYGVDELDYNVKVLKSHVVYDNLNNFMKNVQLNLLDYNVK